MSAIDNVITQIEAFIVANGNEEITADVLRPLLVGLADAVQQTTGDPADLNTIATDLVSAINEVLGIANNAGGLNILSGSSDPNENAPVGQELGAFYAQYVGGVLIGFWQYNGYEWIEIKEDTGGGVLTTTVEISSAQLLNLHTTPVELIPAQGAGKYIVIDSVIEVHQYGTEAYDFSGTTRFGRILIGNAIVATIPQANLNTTVSIVVTKQPFNSIILSENTGIMLDYNGTAPTQGDGTLKLILTYRIINI